MDILNSINEEQLFLGIPIEIPETCHIYTPTLRQIAEIGAKNFYSYLNILTLDKEDIDEFLKEQKIEEAQEELTPFQFTLINAHYDSDYLKNLEEAFKLFLHEEEIYVLEKNEAIILGDLKDNRIINEEKFNIICEIIKRANSVEKPSSEQRMNNPSNSKAAEIIRKIKEGRKLKEKNNHSSLSFLDLVASLAAKGNGLNAINVWDLTYFAFNDQFKRMQAIEEYQQAIGAIHAGADPKKINLKPWIRNFQEEEK